jgi:hypothetical protein
VTLITAIVSDPTLQLVALVAIVAALADLAMGVVVALKRGSFALDEVATFLGTHVLARVLPILSLAAIASALSHGTTNPPAALATLIAGTWAAALAGVLAYAGETVASLQATLTPQPSTKEP